MPNPPKLQMLKTNRRKTLQTRRRRLKAKNPDPDLCGHFNDMPKGLSQAGIIAGFSPIKDEINIWPLLTSLQNEGRHVCLPVVVGPDRPLIFGAWTPGCEMRTDTYGVSFPVGGPISDEPLLPDLVFVPLLGFTDRGERLGYGGGYYDRTLAHLRESGEVFACGVAYAGQEEAELPTDAHDAKLDGILTENGFRAFA